MSTAFARTRGRRVLDIDNLPPPPHFLSVDEPGWLEQGGLGWRRAGLQARGVQGVFSWLIFQRHTNLLGCFWVCLDTPPLVCPLSCTRGSILPRQLTQDAHRGKRERGLVYTFNWIVPTWAAGKVPFDTRFCYFTHSSKVSWMREARMEKGGIGMGWAWVDVWLVRQHVGAVPMVLLGAERLVVLRWWFLY